MASHGNASNIAKDSIDVDASYTRYEKLYAMLLDAIPSSVLLIDRDMRVRSANTNFLEKSRRSLSTTIGRRLEEIFPAVILDNIDITSSIHHVFKTNRPIKGQQMTYRAPGVPIRTYYYSILPFSWHGAVDAAMLLMDDVTERLRLSEEVHRMERHLASVVGSASDIVLSTDTEARILTWNPAAEAISGYTADEVQQHLLFEYCAENYRQEMERFFLTMKGGGNSKMAEWDLITKHKGSIQVSWVLSPMKDNFFRTVGIVGVGRDLTERRKIEMQLLQSQKLAALGVMAGGIAHEIRNPMAICSSGAQFLMEDEITPAFRKECAEKIHSGIRRASVIIENLLRFARPSAATEIVQLDIVSIVKETLILVANQAKIQKIDVESYFPEEQVAITGISSLLQQVFMNLFLNAINAMPDGGRLSIFVEKKPVEVVVGIADTGRGMSRTEMENIFDPFYTTSPVGQGTGLGLSICYSIVKQHFGSIEVDSVEGKGSTFTVKLPIL